MIHSATYKCYSGGMGMVHRMLSLCAIMIVFRILVSPFCNAANAELDEQLITATCEGDVAKVRQLLDDGADPNANETWSRRTPLHFASSDNNLALAKILLQYNANTEARDELGKTPLVLAVQNGRKEMIKLLISKGTDVNARDDHGETPLSWAAPSCYCHIEDIELSLDNGANINAPNDSGITALHCAAVNGDVERVNLLLNRGADINLRVTAGKYSGKTALEMAKLGNKQGFVQAFEDWKQVGLRFKTTKSAANRAPQDQAVENRNDALQDRNDADNMQVRYSDGKNKCCSIM